MNIITPEQREKEEASARINSTPQAVRYSKYKIQLACQKRDLWEQVKGAIAAAHLEDSWANIQDIASDNPELVAALPAIRQAFGSELVDEVLSECVAD